MARQDPLSAVRLGHQKGVFKTVLPVGSIVIRRETGTDKRHQFQVRYIKVRMDGPPRFRWMQYSRWWWEKNRGPVPTGRIVVRKDGDTLNDDPDNLILGTAATKLKIAHSDIGWSREQHRRAAAGIARHNRMVGHVRRLKRYIPAYWYPVVDDMSVILNVPFRRRKRLLACFGTDVSKYPANGHGSIVRKLLEASKVRPVQGKNLSGGIYQSYCKLDPVSKIVKGPISTEIHQIVLQLSRMRIWELAEKYGRKELQLRK